jgi:hypothetical protein
MELLEGQTLHRRIAFRPLPIEEMLGLAIQIADTLLVMKVALKTGSASRNQRGKNSCCVTSAQVEHPLTGTHLIRQPRQLRVRDQFKSFSLRRQNAWSASDHD